jgi:tryptophan synthase alpha chain
MFAAMSRLAPAFAKTRSQKRAAFIAYLCAGDPDFDTSFACCRALLGAGVDVLELGLPFSDPLADGPVNQAASQRALAAGITPERVFELVRRIREGSDVPIVLYAYYNMVFANGVDRFIGQAAAAGVDGLLALDLPPEEGAEAVAAARAHGIDTICLIAPTTEEARLPRIAAAATGFIYYVSREGVTGVRDELAGGVAPAVARIRRHTQLPIAVGFGISRREHVAQIAALADGVVVGSALVGVIGGYRGDRAALPQALAARASDLVAGVGR